MTMESFSGLSPRRTEARSSVAAPLSRQRLTRQGRSAIHSGPFPALGPRPLAGEQKPGSRRRDPDASEHPPRLSHLEGPLRLRRHVGDPLDRRRPAPRHLLELPSLLHREAEADRHAGAHRPVPEEVRERAEGSAKEGEARGSREEGRSKGREEARKEAEDGEEAQGRRLAPPAFAARSECQKNRQRGLVRVGGARTEAATLPTEEGLGGPFLSLLYFSRAATLLRPSSSLSTRSRPWFARRPSRFILLISVETKDRDARTRSARSCCVMPCRQSSFPGARRSPCACARVMSISASRAGTSLRVRPRTR